MPLFPIDPIAVNAADTAGAVAVGGTCQPLFPFFLTCFLTKSEVLSLRKFENCSNFER